MARKAKKIAGKAEALGLILKRGDTDDAGYALLAAKEVDVEDEEDDEDADGDVRLVEERHTAVAASDPLDGDEVIFGHGFTASLEETEAFLDNRAALIGINAILKDRPPVAPPSQARLEKSLGGHEYADEIKNLIGKPKRGRPKKDEKIEPPPEKPAEPQDDDGFDDDPITFPESRSPPPMEYDSAPKATRMPAVVAREAGRRLRLDKGAIRSATDKLNIAKEIGVLYRRGCPVDLMEAGRLLKRKQDQTNHGEWIPWLSNNEATLGFGRMTAHRLIKRADQSSAA
jgi:hypothetical protein